MNFSPLPTETEMIASAVIGAAIAVHQELGPGFLEKIYQEALWMELAARQIEHQREFAVPVRYRGEIIAMQRMDLVVAHVVIVELKASSRIEPVHEAQLISYLRATGLRLGLLLNFNCRTMKEGIKRLVR